MSLDYGFGVNLRKIADMCEVHVGMVQFVVYSVKFVAVKFNFRMQCLARFTTRKWDPWVIVDSTYIIAPPKQYAQVI